MDRSRQKFFPYRHSLRQRAQSLRREPTRPERKLWYEFLSGLPQKFTRQKPLGRYIADFYCSTNRLVIEIDGDTHFSDAAERYDEARTADLGRLGIRVLRFTNADIMQNFDSVCARILSALS